MLEIEREEKSNALLYCSVFQSRDRNVENRVARIEKFNKRPCFRGNRSIEGWAPGKIATRIPAWLSSRKASFPMVSVSPWEPFVPHRKSTTAFSYPHSYSVSCPKTLAFHSSSVRSGSRSVFKSDPEIPCPSRFMLDKRGKRRDRDSRWNSRLIRESKTNVE